MERTGKRLRAVVVGAGWAGEGHTLALRDTGVEVVGKVAQRLGVPEGSTDWREAIARHRPEIVAIGTPGSVRREVVEAAGAVGAHGRSEARIWTCTHLSDSHGFGSGRGRRLGGFEGDGAEVAKAPVPTVRGVPRFDRGEDGLHHVGTRGPGAPVDELDLQGCEEGLRDGVVQAGARPPHRAGDAGLSQQCLEGPGGVGAATVGMVDTFLAPCRSPAVQGHAQRVPGQCGVQHRRRAPSDDPSGPEVDDDGEVQPALAGADGGGVGHPDVVGAGDPADGEGTTAVAPAAPQAEAGHQPGDATPAAADAVRDEVGMDAGTAVGAPAAGMAVLDGHAQRIRGHPARVGVCEAPEAVLPCVVPRPRDPHGLAEGGDWPA